MCDSFVFDAIGKTMQNNKIEYGSFKENTICACVDKLSLKLDKKIILNEFTSIFSEKVGNGKIFKSKESFIWTQSYNFNSFSSLITVNPSHFDTFEDLNKFLKFHIKSDLTNAKVTRLESSVTFPISYNQLMIGVDFCKKRSYSKWYEKSHETGSYGGRRGRKYKAIIYNKKLKNSLPFTASRLEINSFPQGMTFNNLSVIQHYEPFGDTKLYDITLIPPEPYSGPMRDSFVVLHKFINTFGYWKSKKHLNQGRNFNKQYLQYLKLEEITPNINDTFHQGIKPFFNGGNYAHAAN